MWFGLQTVSSVERCPSLGVSFIERFLCMCVHIRGRANKWTVKYSFGSLIFKDIFSSVNICVVIKMAANLNQLIYQPDPSGANTMFVNRADFTSQKLSLYLNDIRVKYRRRHYSTYNVPTNIRFTHLRWEWLFAQMWRIFYKVGGSQSHSYEAL